MMGRLRINLRFAWRNLWRNHRRTLIMLAAIVVGTWAMIFMTALMRGMVDDMVKDGVSALPGHVQIHHPDYRDDPTVDNRMAPPDAELAKTLADPRVVAWTTRVRVPAVISSERDTRGVILIGADPEGEKGLSFVADDIVEGRFLESAEDSGLVVGRKLVERLETELGKRVVVMSQDRDNEIADRGFRIVGIFESRLTQFEEGFVFGGQRTVQNLLGMGDSVSEVAILGHDYRDVEGLYRLVNEAAGPEVEVLPWQKRMTQADERTKKMLEAWSGDQKPIGGTNIHDFLRRLPEAPEEHINRRRLGQTLFYFGITDSQAGNVSLAKRELQRALDVGSKQWLEYELANVELSRLGKW